MNSTSLMPWGWTEHISAVHVETRIYTPIPHIAINSHILKVNHLPAVDSSSLGPFRDGIYSCLLPLRGSLVGREKDDRDGIYSSLLPLCGSLVGREKDDGGYHFGGSSRRVCGGASASGYHGPVVSDRALL